MIKRTNGVSRIIKKNLHQSHNTFEDHFIAPTTGYNTHNEINNPEKCVGSHVFVVEWEIPDTHIEDDLACR